MQPELKKLITAFLGVALITSVTSFAFMRAGTFQGGNNNQLTTNSSVGIKNAFADISQVTPPWRVPQTPPASSATVPASSNMTENFSNIISNELLTAATKTGEINKPALTLAVNTMQSGVLAQIAIASSEVKINDKATLEEQVDYIKSVRDILRSTTEDSHYQTIITTSNPTIEKISAVKNLFDNKRSEVAAMSVPSTLTSLHRALLSYMAGRQNFYGSLSNYQSDPVKTLLVLQNKENVLRDYTTTLTSELAKAGPAIKFSYANEKSFANLNFNQAPPQSMQDVFVDLFGIREAHATLPVIDPSAIAQMVADAIQQAIAYAADAAHYIKTELDGALKWAQTQLEWAERLATEQLKNVLTQLYVQKAVSWINGDGDPQFVTNWRDLAQNALTRGVGKGLYDVSNDVCGTFGAAMMMQLNNSFNAYYMPSNCQPNATGRALDRFRNNSFFDGGWGAYGTAISPQGNYFSSYTDYATRIKENADKESVSAINDALANNGFKSTKICPESDVQGPPSPDGTCPDGSEPQSTTPGNVLQAALDKAVGAPVERIVSAENLIALGLTLAQGAMTKTVAAGPRGLTGLGNGATFAVSSDQTFDLADTCGGYASGTPGFTSCMQNVGSANTVQSDLDIRNASSQADIAATQTIQNLQSTVRIIGQNRNAIVAANTESLNTIRELTTNNSDISTSSLNRVIHACGNFATGSSERDRVPEAQNTKADVIALRDKINQVNTVDLDLMSADLMIISGTTDITRLRTQVDQFQLAYGTAASTTQLLMLAQGRRLEVRNIQGQTEDNLPNLCATPIQRVTDTLLINP